MTAYYIALRPLLARAAVEGFPIIAPFLRRSIPLALAFGIGISVGGILLAESFTDLLYGVAYRAAVLLTIGASSLQTELR